MGNVQLSALFHHYHHKTFSDPFFTELEKEISEKFGEDLGITPCVIQNKLLNPKDIIEFEYDFDIQFEYLYSFYNSVSKNYIITDKIETILKKYCLKVGFFNSNLNELSEFLLKCTYSNIPFNDVLNAIKL
ncbi:hypothetical protein [Confluentibacter sediminis]|uniref:hypothetical protein n=1 Tax=Confluentibacter sediminis TaxID=2219045 RepID=UPI000DAF0D5B|nr:hypothetical protein [Confluentibacter sediminis]